MSDDTTKSAASQPASTTSQTPEQPRQQYGYGLGHFLKFKQRYTRPIEKERNRSFELGYN